MTDRQYEELHNDLREIKSAVLGNPKIGLSGLVSRTERLEAKHRKLDLRMAAVGGAATVIGFLIEHFLK